MNLYCERHNNLAPYPTLFIHGNLASTRWWGPTLQNWKSIVPAGAAPVLVADWRGCGRNPDLPAGLEFSLQDLAADFLELLKRENLDQVNVVGHSLGGLIALQMMIMDQPRFHKAVLLDSVGAKGVVFDDSMYEAFRQMAASPELTGTVILSTILNSDKLDPQLRDQIAEDGYKAVRGIGTSVLEILKSVDLTERAAQVKVPTLILHGRQDAIIPPQDSIQLAQFMPNSQLELIDDAGHCWNVENPRAFVQQLNTFLF